MKYASYRLSLVRLAFAPLLVLVALFVTPSAAFAHTDLGSSLPADGSRVATSPATVEIVLKEKITIPVDAIRIVDAQGNDVPATPAVASPRGTETAVSVTPTSTLPDGWYAVTWQIISADGHPKIGSFTFLVGENTGSKAAAAPADPSAPFRTATDPLNFLGYLTTLLAIGLLFAAWPLASVPEAAAKAQRWAGFASIAGLVVAPITLINFAMLLNGGQTEGIGSVAVVALQSSAGTALLVRTSALFALCTAVLLVSEKSLRFVAIAAAALGGIGLTVSYAMTGHASVVQWKWVAAPALVLHILAGAAWLGGLPAVAWAFRKRATFTGAELTSLISRFSRMATISIAVLGVAGTALAVCMFTAPSEVLGRYGYSLMAKLLLVFGFLALGAYNHYVAVPAMKKSFIGIENDPEGLGTPAGRVARENMGRTLKIEALAVLVIAIATAVLTSSGAPAAGGSHGGGVKDGHGHEGGISAEAIAQISDSTPTVAQAVLGAGGVNISLTPARVGAEAELTVAVTDGAGQPRKAESVVVELSHQKTGIGPIVRKLTASAKDSKFSVKTNDFGVAGEWTITVKVSTGALSVEQATVTMNVTEKSAGN